jgi:hypothetical protein
MLDRRYGCRDFGIARASQPAPALSLSTMSLGEVWLAARPRGC